ncbi:DUF4270 family protein [Hymenobacter mucosus]|uniref:DUF4270 domain-containing protein n=1 Tax=Hymenobacter mucosus TaxID=1411120 RepID=A0A238XQG8_9BACT|nr:DUF4270 family protein [Hymenobacter mucosus]SNR60594.1 protein of unknown function [Hymenobacter mucosus]
MNKVRFFLNQWACRVAGLPVLGLLVLLLASCEEPSDVGSELVVDTTTGTLFVDTLTVRTSTVLVDSVVTSTSSYLLLGQYQDNRLGTITARSYLRLGLGGTTFEPDVSAVYDSVVLLLPTDTYRYGDTTKVQHLAVHRLREPLRPNTKYYAFNTVGYNATPLVTQAFRARPNLTTLRVPLPASLGRELLTAGISRQLSSDDALEARLPGFCLSPGATDNAAILRFLATSTSATLRLYYHLPTATDEALSRDFTIADGSRHFYQLQADRSSTLLSSLTASRQAIASTRTAAEAYIQGGLGLQTKIEVPYLLDLNNLGGTWVLNSAQLQLETVQGTEKGAFAPATLVLQLADRGNHSGSYLTDLNGATLTAAYSYAYSSRTNLEQGSYSFSLTPYYEAALKREVANEGLLLSSTSPDTPERAILGGTANVTNPIKLRVYLTRVQ